MTTDGSCACCGAEEALAVGAPMSDLVLDVAHSRMYLVAPVVGTPASWAKRAGDGSGPVPLDAIDPADTFSGIDHDVDLPDAFFSTLMKRRLVVEPDATPLIASTTAIRADGASVVGVSSGDAEAWFLVVDLRDPDGDFEHWIDVARLAVKPEWSSALCRRFGLELVGGKARTTLVTSLQFEGTPTEMQLRDAALHLATRAPFNETVQGKDDAATRLTASRFRVVTRRVAGFVAGDHGGSAHFMTKFPEEIGEQYLLAVILANWQVAVLNRILVNANMIWDGNGAEQTAARKVPFDKNRRLRQQFDELIKLRGQYARLTTSGSLGPVFDSGSQGAFWDELQDATRVRRRLDEVNEALQNAAVTIETQANLNLERLLAFFTLVIGLPSLAFTVLGVNINRLTSESGLSGFWVVALLVACLALGVVAFFLVSGTLRLGATGTQVADLDHGQPERPKSVTVAEEAVR